MSDLFVNLVSLNKCGYIVAPGEDMCSFLRRIDELKQEAPDTLTFVPLMLQKKFDINPDYVRIIYSDDGIGVWEGACTWIMNNEVSIQLRKSLQSKSHLFWIYSKDELIAHEMVHVVRSHFREPEFEEILAYETAAGWFRRFFGPIFRSSGEAYLSVLLISIGSVLTVFHPYSGLLCILGSAAFFLGRLIKSRFIFSRAKKKIRAIFNINPDFILLRLTDCEIRMVAFASKEEIIDYIDKEKIMNLRWRQICLSYLLTDA
ncbi:MAG: hypothetical protein RSB82_00540 [Victivallaceae bacterium]